jgi:hypothetical protein
VDNDDDHYATLLQILPLKKVDDDEDDFHQAHGEVWPWSSSSRGPTKYKKALKASPL